MRRKQKSNPRRAAGNGVRCEEVRFAQVDYPMPVQPRLVVRFSGGLSLLVENREAIDLAAEFIVAFRAREQGKGGRR